MKKWLCMLLVTTVLGSGRAAEPEPEVAAPIAEATPEWRLAVGPLHRLFSLAHDALQERADYNTDVSADWRDGNTTGNGWGFRIVAGKDNDPSVGVLTFDVSNYTWDRIGPNGDETFHRIDTERRDLETYWMEATGNTDRSFWGWTLGFRYTSLQKSVDIMERRRYEGFKGDITWLMLMGGYHGRIRPFGGRIFEVHGMLNFLFGEASGISRYGNDLDWDDGRIDEDYDDDYSLGYGMNASVGLGFALFRNIDIHLDYRREWMYSFRATDTGVLVFPDNDDALFIENHQGFVSSLVYRF